MNSTQYDAIIIGSGMGGLTTGALLAKLQNKKVLILERHFTIGGFTHVFHRKGKFHWDVGIHYVGDMHKGSMLRSFMDFITDGNLDWNKMNDPFEKFVYPDLTFSLYSNQDRYFSDLVELFPNEKDSIAGFFYDVNSINSWFGRNVTMKLKNSDFNSIQVDPKWQNKSDKNITLKDYLDNNFKDQNLKAILASQWGDYGLPPSKASFAIHSMIVGHYLNGGYYPIGSSSKIAESVKKVIESKGGLIQNNSSVSEIIFEGNKAIGVKADVRIAGKTNSIEFTAPLIYSNAGAITTYKKLLPDSKTPSFLKSLDNLSFGLSNVTLYLGFKDDPQKLGFRGENYWIYGSNDHEINYSQRNKVLDGNPAGLYMSFPSLKNPEANSYTGEAISFVDYEPFMKWKELPWKKRGEEYESLKSKITEGILNHLEKRFPGLKDTIEFHELSTPLTNEHFTGHSKGMIYGLPCSVERFNQGWLGVKTPFENLYLTGADASSPGIAGALMGGVMAYGESSGYSNMIKIIKEIMN
jgi:phytoene dehydrogenase-like protein